MAMPRVSGRLGNQIDLNVTFYKNGVPVDPYAIRKVEVYKSTAQPENLIAEFPILSPTDVDYPYPLTRDLDSEGVVRPGIFHLIWDVPESGISVPDIFFDVWSYIATDPGISTDSEDEVDLSILDNEDLFLQCCNEFWLYNEAFFCDNGLSNIRLGFEPQDIKFNQPEIRTLEVGVMPLPLYDYDYNHIAPIIPQLLGYFSLLTDSNELLIDKEPMRIGLRQGSFRSNPFVLQYEFDTRRVLRGSYQYQVIVCLPNGESRASPYFHLQVS